MTGGVVKGKPESDARSADLCIGPQRERLTAEVRLTSWLDATSMLDASGTPFLASNDKSERNLMPVADAFFKNVCATLAELSKDIFRDSVRQT